LALQVLVSGEQHSGHEVQIKRKKMFAGHILNNAYTLYLHIVNDNTVSPEVTVLGRLHKGK